MAIAKNQRFPRSQKSKSWQTHRKVGRFYQSGETLPPFSNPGGASAGKGSPHDSAWIMPLRTWIPLNLSKASQFGSTLTSRPPPCRFFPIWNRGRRFVPIHPFGGRSQGSACQKFCACLGLRRDVVPMSPSGFLGGMLSFFPSECAKYSRSGYLGEHLRSMVRRLRCR